MIYISFPKRDGQDAPAVLVDRLRSAWITPGVYLILEGVFLGQPGEALQEEHFLVAFDGEPENMGELLGILEAEGLSKPTLWEQSNVIATADEAAAFCLDSGAKDVGGAIYQRLTEALPDSHVVLSNAGRWFLKAGAMAEAVGYLERAFDLAPDVPEIAINLMILRQLQENHQAAAQIFDNLVAKHSDHPLVRQIMKGESA